MAERVVDHYPTLFKVEYEDPAGAFGGWFLFVMNDPDFAGPQHTETTWESNTGGYRNALQASIAERITAMFGTRSTVQWTAKIVEAITPAVLDVDF